MVTIAGIVVEKWVGLPVAKNPKTAENRTVTAILAPKSARFLVATPIDIEYMAAAIEYVLSSILPVSQNSITSGINGKMSCAIIE